ncbi:glucosyltransferase domain-containing protein [Francisella philomiragia]|uniref:glucosyltransferase domain-containing protein n=1 Tax=Francisella philomiragia TaxID=28110 RepID=UPI001908E3FD|nr:glucosyltransferase domain-containing protein [Francisella philomiragia]MBK2092325.1 glucosyltransferase domain-containing protein [Francisella philomiragia]MBK2257399.1 glucosyltransferase domain-containing protein [Francisella philomiragia]MBK2270101.1 glucosyltransferase domain-containing protein [Francisella philomiragia]MBK2271994.1 glucosyltransferase domain-containing protein [Francisella philomiragia]MBK2275775.1 glucosyltransferase domain-containing protein [Francisella philomiragi
MFLLFKMKKLILENLVTICILLFFTILSYGYFITHWAIDSDDAVASFVSSSSLWVSHGVPLLSIYNYLSLEQVIPFFNDFISVCLIFISGIIWLTIIENTNTKLSKTSILVFACVFTICPMYSFFLRYTLSNMFIELSLLISALSIYHYSCFLKNRSIFHLSSSIILCSISLLSYQTYVASFITSVVFVALLREINGRSTKQICTDLVYGAIILAVSLALYITMTHLAYMIVPKSTYTEEFIGWGKLPFSAIISSWQTYFYSLFSMSFNFLMLLALVVATTCLILKYIFKKRVFAIVLILLLIASPFTLTFILGKGMPLRTLQAVPLMVAALWFLFYQSCSTKISKKIIIFVIIISTFFNAQHINRLFYSDVMRASYDKTFANRIYNQLLAETGSAVENKPLVIVGRHLYSNKPFIVHFDSIGPSFFDTDAEMSERLHYYMKWLNNDYIMPSEAQVNDAYMVAEYMPSYPSTGYIKETKDLLILKLSDKIKINPESATLNLKGYEALQPSNAQSHIDSINLQKGQLSISGWGYIKDKDAKNTKTFIKITNKNKESIYPVNIIQRPDIKKQYHDATNIQDSGWNIFLDNPNITEDSKVSLIMTNNQNYIQIGIKTPKKTNPINLNLNKYNELPYTSQKNYINTFSFNNKLLVIRGWAYINGKKTSDSSIYINLHNSKHNYIYRVQNTDNSKLTDTSNKDFNFNSLIDIPKANYKVSLILTNGDSYTIADTGLRINMCSRLNFLCW